MDSYTILSGPSWLHSEIPDTEDPIQMPEACKTKQRKLKKTVTMLVTDDIVDIGSLINYKDFGSKIWVTAYVLRFVRVLRRKSAYSSKCVTPEELNHSL